MHPIKNLVIALKQLTVGNKYYYAWIGFLGLLIFVGAVSYGAQLKNGLIVTAMRDQVSWGFYIANFTFLVGVAANCWQCPPFSCA
jgi:molybdopterin-containing oxidoreductase family membrane subunit